MAGARIKFPDPKKCTQENPAVLCPADRLLGLYNQDSGKSAKKISKTVRGWFAREASSKGWAGVNFVPDVQSKHGAGCVLWLPPQQINIKITKTTNVLVLQPQSE